MHFIYISTILRNLARPLVLIMMLVAVNTQAQTYPMEKGWMVGASGGMVSFFGDLSVHDNSLLKKINDESDAGFSLMVGKQLGPLLSVKANYLKGRMKGSNPGLGYNFTNQFNEVSFTTELNLTKLIVPSSDSRLRCMVALGVGALNGNARKVSSLLNTPDPDPLDPNMESQLSNFQSVVVLVTGAGVDYKLSKHWRSSLWMSMHTTRNDELDGHLGTSTMVNDHFSYLSLGLTYVISPAGNALAQGYPCSPW